jgi:L-rhamnose mutarotase
MKQVCYIQKIKPELKEEYKKAHDKIWPEYIKVLKDAGLNNSSTFFKKDGTIILYTECENPVESFSKIAASPFNTKWQKEMDKYIIKEGEKLSDSTNNLKEVDALSKVRQGLEILEQIFYLE